jgi:hypothetical protein
MMLKVLFAIILAHLPFNLALASNVCPIKANIVFDLNEQSHEKWRVLNAKPRHVEPSQWLDPLCEYEKLIFIDDSAKQLASYISYSEMSLLKSEASLVLEGSLFKSDEVGKSSNTFLGNYKTFDWHTLGTAGSYTDVVKFEKDAVRLVNSVHTQFGEYSLLMFGFVWPHNSALNFLAQLKMRFF